MGAQPSVTAPGASRRPIETDIAIVTLALPLLKS
jgi:hypothetical protein